MPKTLKTSLTEGPLLKKLIIYALPLLATNVLQILFNAADITILSIFVNKSAMAAVGSTSSLINLITGLFVGLSVGANVLAARAIGAKDQKQTENIIGTSLLVSVIAGAVLALVGVFLSRTFLTWMSCPPEDLDMAVKYMTIYFIGMPIIMIYNFSASILRAAGETLRPLLFLLLGGALNVGLDIFFILVVKLDVEGVAIATVASQTVSAVMCLITLFRGKCGVKAKIKALRVNGRILKELIKIGVPAGIQGCMFSIANVILQSSVNALGEDIVAANALANQFDNVSYQALNAVSLTALSFIGQNLGAGKIDRVRKTVWESVLIATVLGISLGGIIVLLAPYICRLISNSQIVVEEAYKKIVMLCSTYCLCGIMEVLCNAVRGLGKSTTAMLVNLTGTCVFRIFWIKVVFEKIKEIYVLYAVYPISWALVCIIFLFIYFPLVKKVQKRFESDKDLHDISPDK